jgi:hypothetical protein
MTDDAVEAPIRKRLQILRVTLRIRDPARIGGFVLTRVTEHLCRNVDTRHRGAKTCQQPRILALATRERQHLLARDASEQLREDGVDEPESLRIERAAVFNRDLVVSGMRRVPHRPPCINPTTPAAASPGISQGGRFDGFVHVDDWVPQRLVTATGPKPVPR